MAVLGPGGSIAAAKTNEKNKTPSGKSLGTGTNAIFGGGAQAQSKVLGPGGSLAAAQTPAGKAVDAAVRAAYTTKSTGSSGGEAPTIERVGTPTEMPPGWTSTPNATDTTDQTGRPQYQGTTNYVPHPSGGQLLGLGASMIPGVGALNTLGGVMNDLLHGRSPTISYSGGLLGQSVDETEGSTPGSTTGYVGNRVASSTNSRGGVRPADDTRLFDRASAAARDEIAGGSPDVTTGGDDGGAEFSSVKLADRRRPYDELSAVDLLRGLL